MNPAAIRVKPAHLKAALAQLAPLLTPGDVVAMAYHNPWTEAADQTINGRKLHLVSCHSVLAFREQLLQPRPQPLVILTPLDMGELGEDVCARLWNQKVHRINRWDLVHEVYGVAGRAGNLHSWMIDLLLEVAQHRPDSRPPTALTERFAWNLLTQFFLGWDMERPDIFALTRWSAEPDAGARLAAAPPALTAHLGTYVFEYAGQAGITLLDAMNRGAASPMALALACDVLYGRAEDVTLGKAQGRLEQYFSGTLHPDPCRQWATAARETTESLLQREQGKTRAMLQEADQLLLAVGAAAYAHLGDLSLLGLDQRLTALAQAVGAVLEGADLQLVDAAVGAARSHRLLQQDSRRRERLLMARRLLLYLQTPTPRHTHFAAAAHYHDRHTGFVSWARRLLAESDENPALARALADLADRVRARVEQENRAFALLLKRWNLAPTPAPGQYLIEDVLPKLLAPLSEAGPTLLLVLDGMDGAVFRQLLEDMAQRGWMELVPAGQPHAHVVTLLPTITKYCRASLFCGTPTIGEQTVESKGFANHPALAGKTRPKLWHKTPAGEAFFELRTQLLNKGQRVIAVVFNGPDDYLSSSDQLNVDWRVDQIKGLAAVLEAAQESGRTVILTADHGHVLEEHSRLVNHPDGQRWRRAFGPIEEDEVLIEGPRVITEDQRVILPAVEGLRYGKRNTGYHGGAAPREVIVPLAVLTAELNTAHHPPGWVEIAPALPDWWIAPGALALAQTTELARPVPIPLGPQPDPEPTTGETPVPPEPRATTRPDPAEITPSPALPTWAVHLLASPLFQQRLARQRRARPSLDELQAVFTHMEERDGRSTPPALGRVLNKSAVRLRGFFTTLVNLLNLDGYPVFTVEENQICLNRALLRHQFELNGPGAERPLAGEGLGPEPPKSSTGKLSNEPLANHCSMALINAMAEHDLPHETVADLVEPWRDGTLFHPNYQNIFPEARDFMAAHWDRLIDAYQRREAWQSRLDTALAQLGLGTRALNGLIRAEVADARGLAARWCRDPLLSEISGLGPVSLRDIMASLNRMAFGEAPAGTDDPHMGAVLERPLTHVGFDSRVLKALAELGVGHTRAMVEAWRLGLFFREEHFLGKPFKAVRAFVARHWDTILTDRGRNPADQVGRPLKTLGLSTRPEKALTAKGVATAGDLAAWWCDHPDLENVPKLGKKSHLEILRVLGELLFGANTGEHD